MSDVTAGDGDLQGEVQQGGVQQGASQQSGAQLRESLQREHRRAVAAEAALADLRRRYEVLELRNRELAGILDALSRRGRLEGDDSPETTATDTAASAGSPA